MRATVMFGAGDVRIEAVPDARLIEPTDALVAVTRAAICGSDLWPYKTMPHDETGRRMGHEFIGVVEAVGADVRSVKAGPGKAAVVVGDGAVGLCGVIAAKRLGAEQIILLGRHPDRIALAREFGATEVVSERGEEAVERVRELTGGFGAHAVLECVGLEQSLRTALAIARPGGAVGRVGAPQQDSIPEAVSTFFRNVTVGGGGAPARAYIEELLPDVLEGRIEPGRVFDRVTSLDGVPDGYRAMNEREAIKVLVEL